VSGNYDNIRVYADKDTEVYLAPKGTPAPTALGAPAAPWKAVGWLSEDGLTEGLSVESTKIRAFQGGTTVRSRPKSTDRTFKFTALEDKLDNAELFNGPVNKTVSGTAPNQTATYTKPAAVPSVEKAVLVRRLDGTVEEVEYFTLNVTERGDVVDNGDTARQYEVTGDIIGNVTVLTNNPAYVA
jgi:hypothetical protein